MATSSGTLLLWFYFWMVMLENLFEGKVCVHENTCTFVPTEDGA